MGNDFLTMFLSNWYVIFALVILVIASCVLFVRNLSITRMKEWLKYAVTIAEKELGSGTGQLKLRQVYDMFIKKFPVLSNFIPFSIFSKMVDLALEWMNEQIKKNNKIKEFIEK